MADQYMNLAGDCLLFAETMYRAALPTSPTWSGLESHSSSSSTNTGSSSSPEGARSTKGMREVTAPAAAAPPKYNSSASRRQKPVLNTFEDILSFMASLGKGDLEKMTAQQHLDMAQLDDLSLEEIERHQKHMRGAIEMAKHALNNDETPVGCVFVHNDQVIGRGMNHTNKTLNGTRHAEFVALAEILQVYPPEILKQTDLYVTVEPCIMCASALRQYGLRAVYFGCFNDRFGGTGGVLRVHDDDMSDAKILAIPGVFREEAIMLLRKFYIQENEKAPEPKQKKTRELKTDIVPLDLTKHRHCVSPLSIASSLASPFANSSASASGSPTMSPATTPLTSPVASPFIQATATSPIVKPIPMRPSNRTRSSLARTVLVGQAKAKA